MVILRVFSLGLLLTGTLVKQEHPRAFGQRLTWQVIGNVRSGSAFYVPTAVGVDARGQVYVLDAGNDRIVKLSPAGHLLKRWRIPSQRSRPGVDQVPMHVAVDRWGNLYVPEKVCLTKYFSSGSPSRCLSRQFGVNDAAVAVGGRGNVFVAGPHGVTKLSPDGRKVADWKFEQPGEQAQAINLAVDQTGIVYAIVLWRSTSGPGCQAWPCSSGFRIDRFSPVGQPMPSWTIPTIGEGELQKGSAVSVDSTGNVCLATG
jgi:hypothetical protein